MHKPTAVFILISVIGLAAVAGVWQLFKLDLISNRYETFSALEESESWQRGWVPEFVPQSATDIVEEHDLDTNSVYGEFSAPDFTRGEDVDGSRMLDSEERSQLLESLPVLGVRRGIGDQPIFRWCGEDQGMFVHFYIRSSGRVIYWGDADANC